MSKIILYDQLDCEGQDKEFLDDAHDLSVWNFANAARSVRVLGQHWVVYTGTGFQHDFKVFGPGDYNLGALEKKINSLRLVKVDLRNPEIVLYEHIKFMGTSRRFRETINDLRRTGFMNLISSCEVKQGVWILYMGTNQTGPRIIAFEGESTDDCRNFGWNDRPSSVRALANSDLEV